MPSLKPAFSSVNICCACDEKYAFPLAVSLYSMLENANKKRYYDIIILHSSIPSESREPLEKLGDHFPNCSVRFADMTEFRGRVKNAENSYITAETNYRLAVLGELFANYNRLIYLDCDTITEGDISKLFDTDLEDNAVGGAPASDVRLLCLTKKGFFIDGIPYNIEDYAVRFMGLKEPERYFNAGVLLFDLKKCRELTSEKEAVELLNRRKWMYNDQDVLNMLFSDSLYLLDIKWNYTVNIESGMNFRDPAVTKLMKSFRRSEYGIIHYSGKAKPWSYDVPMREHYLKYENKFKEVILCQ